MNANNLKVEFINWLIKRYKAENIILGNEVLFSVDKCRADIVMLKNNKIFAYELKSDSDNFIDIDVQLNHYMTTFNYTYIVLTAKHKKQIDILSQYNIGIILYEKFRFKILKNPTLSKIISIDNLVEFLHKNEMKELIQIPKINKTSVFKYRNIVSNKCSKKKIQEQAYKTLEKRYARLYNLFLIDTSKDSIMIEDLKTLTGNITTDKLY